jgi:hypothetical protein
VILLEIDPESVAMIEFEGDALRSIHVNRVACRPEALQRMKIEAREVHFLGSCSSIQPVQSAKDAFMQPDVDLRGSAALPQIGERLAPEAFDHPPEL